MASTIRTQLSREKRRLKKGVYAQLDQWFGSNLMKQATLHHRNDYRFREDQIAFVHLPKTGGTSLRKVLRTVANDTFVRIDIHSPISKYCPPSDYRYITVLRDPVDRVWSLYQMVLRHSHVTKFTYYKEAKQGINVFLKNNWETKNLMCRYFSGDVTNEVNEPMLQRAFKNLKQFHAVLSFQNYEAEVNQFLEQSNLPKLAIPNERQSTYQPPSDAERAQITAANRYDIRLLELWTAYKKQEIDGRTN
jgi:hypothetical protein